MAIVINGSGTVTGLAVGGLPDGTVDDGTVASGIASSKLTGALPAISGASLTGFTDAQMPAGSVLQVVSDTLTSTASTSVLATGGSWADTGLSVAITPSSTSSKIVISGMVNTGSNTPSNGCCLLRLMRASTAIAVGDSASARTLASTGRGAESAGVNTILTQTIHWIDSPSTASAVTYKIQFASRGAGAGTSYINRTSTDSDNYEHQRTASSLTLMEIAG